MSTLIRNFTMFLHNMVEHNPKNIIKKKRIVCYVYCSGLKYICTKNILVIVLKNVNIFQK